MANYAVADISALRKIDLNLTLSFLSNYKSCKITTFLIDFRRPKYKFSEKKTKSTLSTWDGKGEGSEGGICIIDI